MPLQAPLINTMLLSTCSHSPTETVTLSTACLQASKEWQYLVNRNYTSELSTKMTMHTTSTYDTIESRSLLSTSLGYWSIRPRWMLWTPDSVVWHAALALLNITQTLMLFRKILRLTSCRLLCSSERVDLGAGMFNSQNWRISSTTLLRGCRLILATYSFSLLRARPTNSTSLLKTYATVFLLLFITKPHLLLCSLARIPVINVWGRLLPNADPAFRVGIECCLEADVSVFLGSMILALLSVRTAHRR